MITTKVNGVVEKSCSARFSVCTSSQEGKAFNRSQELVLMNRHWLSPYLIDSLAETQQDWINLLQQDWSVELYSLSLRGITHEINSLKHCQITIREIVALTLQAPYQCFVIAQQVHCCYTCCLHIVGLGRVRLVVSFNSPKQTGAYGVLLTNCLAWSSRTVLTRWLEGYPLTALYHGQVLEQQLHRNGLLETTLCRSIA